MLLFYKFNIMCVTTVIDFYLKYCFIVVKYSCKLVVKKLQGIGFLGQRFKFGILSSRLGERYYK